MVQKGGKFLLFIGLKSVIKMLKKGSVVHLQGFQEVLDQM